MGLQGELMASEETVHRGNHKAGHPETGMPTYWFDEASIRLSTVGTCCGHTLNWHSESKGHCRAGNCTCQAFKVTAPVANPDRVKAEARAGQVGGDHYRQYRIQPWDIWQEYGLNAFEGAVLKYLLRRKGNRLEDLKKARHTLDRLIEIEEGDNG